MGKRLLLVLLSAFVMLSVLAACQDEAEEEEATDASAEETAEAFLTHLADENYEAAYALVDETMENQIGVEDLEALWTDIAEQLGEHIEFEYQQTDSSDDHAIVFVESHHAKEDIVFQVTINTDLEVAGFFIV